MNCQRKGCLSQATGGIAINVPAIGHEINAHEPIRVTIGLALCDRCLKETTAHEIIEADPQRRLQNTIQMMCHQQGKIPPDFGRAFISKVEFDSPEWIRLKAKQG